MCIICLFLCNLNCCGLVCKKKFKETLFTNIIKRDNFRFSLDQLFGQQYRKRQDIKLLLLFICPKFAKTENTHI